MNKLKIAFFGSPSFSARVLQKIIDDTDLPVSLQFVVTQPDRKAGRKQILTPTPVNLLAKKHNIPVYDNLKLEIINLKLQEIDLVLLYAFGELLPISILELPARGFWNIHPSLLPKYRNTSPIAYSLLLGDKITGVSLTEMDEKLDHGPILMQREYKIQDNDTREDLENKLSDIGYELFKQSIQKLIDGTLEKQEQDHEKRTFTRLLTKQHGFIPFPIVQKMLRSEILTKNDCPPLILDYFSKYGVSPTFDFRLSTFHLFKALSPWPGLWTLISIKGVEKRLKITGMKLDTNGYPHITMVQLEGKKEVNSETLFHSVLLST